MPIKTQFPVWFGSAYVVNEKYNSQFLTGYSGTLSETNHTIHINQAGVKLQHQNSMEMKDGFSLTYATPDYATLGTAAANAKNDIYTKLAYKANLMSQAVNIVPVTTGRQPYVALLCEIAGTATSQTVTGLGSVTLPTLTEIVDGTIDQTQCCNRKGPRDCFVQGGNRF